MLKGKLIHPDILAALGQAGHGSRILIADGNYPFSTKLGPVAKLVSLKSMTTARGGGMRKAPKRGQTSKVFIMKP